MDHHHRGQRRVGGEYTSLAFNWAGNPRISYYDNTNGDLKYASYNGAAWAITTVDSAGEGVLYVARPRLGREPPHQLL